MPTPTTPDLILEAARLLFNEHGYAATTQSSIAAEVGIAQGNLTYHFPAKRDLVVALRDEASALVGERAATHQPSDVCTDYAAHVAFMMDLVWRYRFLLRDRAQLVEAGLEPGASPQMVADLARLTGLVRRFDEEGLVRRGAGVDLDSLARSLWIVARYWLDHVDEFEHIDSAHWSTSNGVSPSIGRCWLRASPPRAGGASTRRSPRSPNSAAALSPGAPSCPSLAATDRTEAVPQPGLDTFAASWLVKSALVTDEATSWRP